MLIHEELSGAILGAAIEVQRLKCIENLGRGSWSRHTKNACVMNSASVELRFSGNWNFPCATSHCDSNVAIGSIF